MADVAQTALAPVDFIDYDNYQEGGPKSYAPPPDGRYFGRAPIFPMTDDPDVFQRTQEGKLKVVVDPITIVGGEGDGYTIRFTRLSAKKYSNREGNQIIDFIRACGLDLRPQTEEEYKQALRQCSGRPLQFGLRWEAYRKDAVDVKGMENFPIDNNGKPQPWVDDPFEQGKRVWANGKIRYFVSGLQKN